MAVERKIRPELVREYLRNKKKMEMQKEKIIAFASIFVALFFISAFIGLNAVFVKRQVQGFAKKTIAPQEITTQKTQIIAGQATHWIKTIPISAIGKDKNFINLPKSAANIVVKAVSAQTPIQQVIITDAERKNLVALIKQVKSSQSVNKKQNYAANLTFRLWNSFSADLGDVVEQILPSDLGSAPAPTDITQTPDATVVDVSNVVLAEIPVTPEVAPPAPETVTPPPTETPQFVQVSYDTPAPEITAQNTSTGQLVTVSAPAGTETPDQPLTDVLAFSKIPPIFKVGEENKIKIKWKNNGNQNVTFHAEDTNNDGYLDYVEWTVPHLSGQEFSIIFISKAFQLDASQNILADIYDLTKTKDNNWASLTDGQYVRATFFQTLTSKNDNTIYARPAVIPAQAGIQSPSIQVFPVYTDADGNQTEGPLVATFPSIDKENTYRVLLTNLQTPTDVFDLKISGNIDIDWIVDPTYCVGTITNADCTSIIDSGTNCLDIGTCSNGGNGYCSGYISNTNCNQISTQNDCEVGTSGVIGCAWDNTPPTVSVTNPPVNGGYYSHEGWASIGGSGPTFSCDDGVGGSGCQDCRYYFETQQGNASTWSQMTSLSSCTDPIPHPESTAILKLYVAASDAAGNIPGGASVAYPSGGDQSFTYDDSTPNPGSIALCSSNGCVGVYSSNPTVNGSYNGFGFDKGILLGGSHCWYSFDGGVTNSTPGSPADAGPGSPLPDALWFVNGGIYPSEGSNSVTIYCQSANGHTGSVGGSFTYDTTAPLVGFATGTSPSGLSLDAAGWTALAPAVSCGGGCDSSTCKYSYTTSTYGDMTGDCSGGTILAPSSDGTYTLYIAEKDLGGNEGDAQTASTFTYDTTAPTVSVTNPPQSGTYYNVASWASLSPHFSCDDGIGGSGCDAASCQLSWDSITWSNPNGCGAVLPNPGDGTNLTLYVKYNDLAGNPGANSYTGFNYDATAPTGCGISSITANSSAQLTVLANTASDATPPISYQFQETTGHSGASSSDWQESTTFVDSGLSPNTQYTYEVKAKDNLGNTNADYSATVSKYTLSNVPSAPTLAVVSSTSLSATINENSNPAATTFSIKVGSQYVQANGTLGVSAVYQTKAIWGSPKAITGLSVNTQYTVSVNAKNGDSVATAYSSTASATTLGGVGTACNTDDDCDINLNLQCTGGTCSDIGGADVAPPTNVGISSITADSSAQLTVLAKTAVDDTPPISYQFLRTGSTASAWQTSTTYVDSTGLSPNTQYSYQVKAKDSLGNTNADYSSAVSKYTLANVPSSLILAVNSATQITATWSANSNPDGTQYYASASATPSGWITDKTFAVSGLTCNTAYTFTVKAKNGDGTETATASASATTSACASQITTTPTGGSGGGRAITYLPPSPPANGFLVQINNGEATTTNQNVMLILRGSPDVFRMSVSNDPNFINASQEPYAITKQWKLSDGQGQKIVYVKFFTFYGVASEIITATINYGVYSVFNPPASPTTPTEPTLPKLPLAATVIKTVPTSLSGVWNILPTQPIGKLTAQATPVELKNLASVPATINIGNLNGVNLTLPSLGQLIAHIPTDVVFVKTAGGLSDVSTTLTIGDNGLVQQQVETTAGSGLQLIIKPSKPTEAIAGYLIFKQNKAVDIANLKQALVVSQFSYQDTGKDGIWTANITVPVVDGDYEVINVIKYQDPKLQPKELHLTTVIDPEGYVFYRSLYGETRIKNAKVSLFWLNPSTSSGQVPKYELWPAKNYQQTNPQTTSADGSYSFLVPAGTYYLQVSAPWYASYKSQALQVSGGNEIHQNIELHKSFWVF